MYFPALDFQDWDLKICFLKTPEKETHETIFMHNYLFTNLSVTWEEQNEALPFFYVYY